MYKDQNRRNMERLQKQSCEHLREMATEQQLMTDILWNDIIALHRKLQINYCKTRQIKVINYQLILTEPVLSKKLTLIMKEGTKAYSRLYCFKTTLVI